MKELRGITLSGTETTIAGAAVEAFKHRLRGALIDAEDEGYEQARQVWNGMIDKRPALIARCTGVADVVESITFQNFSVY